MEEEKNKNSDSTQNVVMAKQDKCAISFQLVWWRIFKLYFYDTRFLITNTLLHHKTFIFHIPVILNQGFLQIFSLPILYSDTLYRKKATLVFNNAKNLTEAPVWELKSWCQIISWWMITFTFWDLSEFGPETLAGLEDFRRRYKWGGGGVQGSQ